MALDNEAPVELVGIDLDFGGNRWFNFLERAARRNRFQQLRANT